MGAEKEMAADGATFARRWPLFEISTRQQIRVFWIGVIEGIDLRGW